MDSSSEIIYYKFFPDLEILKKLDIKSNDKSLKLRTGFTIIELLVVLVIIGIMMSFAVLSVTTGDPPNSPKFIIKRLKTLMDLTSEEAILQSKEIGIEFSTSRYRFYLWKADKWQTMTEDKIFRPREIPEILDIELHLDGQNIILEEKEGKEPQPQIAFLSTGELIPFELYFTDKKTDESWHFSGMPNGQIKVTYENPNN